MHAFGRVVGILVLGLNVFAGHSNALLRPKAQATRYQNLQVLPQDVSQDELAGHMLENLLGLGLPRRQSEGCLHCHVGDMEAPTETWDFASDSKLPKRQAREMMRMVVSINTTHLASVEKRKSPEFRVTCTTCHAGRLDPRPLPELLWSTWEEDGLASTIARYRDLRERHFASDAYDFRVGVLGRISGRLSQLGAYDDAVEIAALEAEMHPGEPSAQRAWIIARLERSNDRDGIDVALGSLDALAKESSETAVGIPLLDSFGWRLYRRDKTRQALTVFRRNLERFPEDYIPHESLADALWFADEKEPAIAIFEDWLERYPDHTMARRRLVNLYAER